MALFSASKDPERNIREILKILQNIKREEDKETRLLVHMERLVEKLDRTNQEEDRKLDRILETVKKLDRQVEKLEIEIESLRNQHEAGRSY